MPPSNNNGGMLPHSKEAEQGVLGSVIHNNRCLAHLRGLLEPGHFFSPAHRDIFAAMLELETAEQPVDEITLCQSLRRADKLEQAGGMIYIAELVDLTPVASNVELYAKIVLEEYARREAIVQAGELAAKVRESGEGYGETLQQAGDLFRRLAEEIITGKTLSLKEGMNSAFRRLEEGPERSQNPIRTHTALDQWLNSLTPGYLTIVGARTSNFKTACVTQIAVDNALSGHPVLFITLEMTTEDLSLRILSLVAEVESNKLLRGDKNNLDQFEWDALLAAEGKLKKCPLVFEGNGRGMSTGQIGHAVRKAVVDYGIKLVVLDHLKKIISKGFDGREKQSNRVMALSDLAKETGLPFLVAAQVNREGDEQPRMSQLEWSGDIEQEADAVILLQKVDEYRLNVYLAKVRNGPTFGKPIVLTLKPSTFRIGPGIYTNVEDKGQGSVQEDMPF